MFYAFFGLFLLFLGGFLYLIFRENTYIADIFEDVLFVEKIRDFTKPFESDFLKYYFQDFLWAVSLNLELFAVSKPSFKHGVFCSIVTLIFGTLWETLQYLKIINGTGDICDILMYIFAVIFALLIFIKKEKIK